MTGFKVPLALSLAAHAIVLAVLLLVLPAPLPPVELPRAAPGIEVAIAPALPQPAQPPAPPPPASKPPPPRPPVAAPPPPPPPPPPVTIKPPPSAPEATEPAPPPPPPPKPAVPPLPARPPRRVERPIEPQIEPPVEPRQLYRPYVPPAPPVARAPPSPPRAPAPSTTVNPGYRAQLSEWLEAHKRYPETARDRNEQGRAILRFVVERNGRVASYAIVKSTGYPDLDAAIDDMMRGAVLPPFPPAMGEASIEVSVAIRFSLGQ